MYKRGGATSANRKLIAGPICLMCVRPLPGLQPTLADALPCALHTCSMDEERTQWRPLFARILQPLVRDSASTTEAAQQLNKELWKLFNVRYKADQTPARMSPPQARHGVS